MKCTAEDLTLVILPGFNGTDALFSPLRNSLPANAKVKIVSYPLEGLGDFNNYLDYVVDKLSEFSSFILLAESFSGPLAVHALSRLREQPRGIIFCASFLRCPRPILLYISRLVPLGRLVKSVSKLRFAYTFLLGSANRRELVEDFSTSINTLPPSTISERLRNMITIPKPALLDSSAIRACYLQASQDCLVPQNCVKDFVNIFPNLDIRKISAPHFILQCAPCEAAQEICDFVGTL